MLSAVCAAEAGSLGGAAGLDRGDRGCAPRPFLRRPDPPPSPERLRSLATRPSAFPPPLVTAARPSVVTYATEKPYKPISHLCSGEEPLPEVQPHRRVSVCVVAWVRARPVRAIFPACAPLAANRPPPFRAAAGSNYLESVCSRAGPAFQLPLRRRKCLSVSAAAGGAAPGGAIQSPPATRPDQFVQRRTAVPGLEQGCPLAFSLPPNRSRFSFTKLCIEPKTAMRVKLESLTKPKCQIYPYGTEAKGWTGEEPCKR